MPITLGCPSCGKRFRARDESAGKRVKCPYCQAAVPVPSAEEAASASAPTDVVPTSADPFLAAPPPVPPGRPSPLAGRPGAPGASVPVSSPDEWGAGGLELTEGGREPAAVPEPARPAPPPRPVPSRGDVAKAKPAPPPPRAAKPVAPPKTPKTAEQIDAPGWKKAKGGLTWVLIGLFWLALPGFVPFGKKVYERSVGDLPTGDGWVKIEGYVNTNDKDSIKVSKTEEINFLAYGVPFLLGGFALTIGRLTAGAVPRSSGAKGLFGFSGLFTLVAVAGMITYVVCKKLKFDAEMNYGWLAFLVGGSLAEFWFLLALGAIAGNLKQPGAVRTIGFFALVIGVAVLIQLIGWDEYVKRSGRPKPQDAGIEEWLLFEAAAGMLGWLILIGTYWRAVRATRSGIREWLSVYKEQQPATAA